VNNWQLEALRVLAYTSLPTDKRNGRSFRNLVAPIKVREFMITVGVSHKPYGRSTHQSSYYSHITRGLLFVWHRGRLQLVQVRWRCNARTQTFRLMDEPDSPVCPACQIVWPGREASR
jgi:hypothetical protein